jgi:hypothetical protein
MVLAIGIALAFGIGALAQGGDEKLAVRSVPAGLAPYADVALVIENARRVIGALGTAKFEVVPREGRQGAAECNSEEVQSFNRGYVLAHTGFNMLLALQERGFTEISGANGLANAKRRRFVQFGRSALLGSWSPKQLGRLLEVRQSLASLPAHTKTDLAAFLSKLREYRAHYVRLKAAKPDVLDELFRRENDDYYWYRSYLETVGPRVADILKKMPDGLGYHELSGTLDKELREVSDIAKSDPHACYVEYVGLAIAYPQEKLERDYNPIYATKYMVSFWRRREMEGTAGLADYVIGQVLEVLRRP